MKTATTNEIHAVRTGVGYWICDDHTFIRITGKDAASWLHNQTTNNVEALQSGGGHANALLDRQGRLQAHFTLHRWDDEFWLILEKKHAPSLLEQLDAHLFIEDVSIEQADDDLQHLVLQGPETCALLSRILDDDVLGASSLLPVDLYGCHPVEMLGVEALAFRLSQTGEDGFTFIVERVHADTFLSGLREKAGDIPLVPISPEAREILRIEAGIPRYGIDMNPTNTIPETTLERSCISYDKGCYLGQEVVARLRAYGSVKRALVGLIFDNPETVPPCDTDIFVEEKRVGRIKSGTMSPTLGAPIAMAYLDRENRAPDTVLNFTADNTRYTARVITLPFYTPQTREQRARALYDEALTLFQNDLQDKDETAIPVLKTSILLDPGFEDAYEVLGVILHRHHRIDEAIHYMKILGELNPESMMVHTNLSVFYLAKSMIQEAEEEKAKAAVLGIQKSSDDRRAKELAEYERKKIREEATEHIEMFKEVLEIDADDPVATFGIAKAYVQLNEHAKAVPYLRQATEIQSDFSAAFLDLGKCLEFLAKEDEAVVTYKSGIAAASRKGDLMPMREMERRLKALEAQKSKIG